MARWLEVDSNDNLNISSATLIGSYTCDADREIYATIYAQGLAGSGDYVYYLTVTPSGLSEGEAIKTTQTLGAVTVLFAQSIAVNLRSGDVLKVYIDGLAGDTTTPDTRVNFYEANIDNYVAVSATTAATVASGSLALETFHTFAQSVTSTTTSDVSAATKLWLAIKTDKALTDAQSLIFIEKTGGLTVVNGATYATIANGSLTVSGSSGAWVIAIKIEEAVTALLDGLSGTYYAEVKALVSSDTVPVWAGDCVVSQGVVRAVA